MSLAAGCVSNANPDEQFKSAWQASENDVKAYGENMRAAMGPEGSTNYDIKALSSGSKTMIGTLDRHHDTISKIQVSAKYAGAKQEYLAALSDLRMACVDLSKAEDAGSTGALGYIMSSAPWLESSQQKRDNVKKVMNA